MINLKKALKKRRKKKTKDKNLGSHLKRKRIELKRNQDWVARGICSVSYLSKIENNKAEENQTLVREIMERLDVDPKIFKINMKDELYLKKAVYAYYFHEYASLEEIYQEVKDIEHNLTINLVKLYYMVAFKDERAESLVLILEQVIANMSDFDLQAFMVIAGYFYQSQKEYLFSYELFKVSLSISQYNEYLTALSNKKVYEIKQYLQIKNSSYKYFTEAERLMQKHHNRYRLNKLSLQRVLYLLNENPYEANEILKTLQHKEFDNDLLAKYYILSAKVKQKLQNEGTAKMYLEVIKSTSKHYLDALFLLYQLTDDDHQKEEIAKKIEGLDIEKDQMDVMIQFRLMRENNIAKQKEYLKTIAIPYAKKTYNLSLFFDFVTEISEICMNTSRYKEATQYIKSYVYETKKTKRFIEEVAMN